MQIHSDELNNYQEEWFSMNRQLTWIKEHIMDIMIWGLIVFFAFLYISLVFNYNIWTDEAFTLQLVHGNLQEIIQGTADDVHPPLYYFYSKLFFALTNGSGDVVTKVTLWVQKMSVIIPQIGTFALIATVFRKRFGDIATFMSILFFACIPCTMEFSVQVRMYSLSLFFVTLCGIYAYEAYMENKKMSWLWVCVGALGAAYSHYFAFISIIVTVGFLFLAIVFTKRKLFRNWLISAACMIIGYLPWIPSFISQITRVRESYWIPEITPEVIRDYFIWTFDLQLVPGVVYGVMACLILAGIVMLVQLIRKRENADVTALLAMLIPTLTTVLGVIISLSKSPIYRDQYVFPALMLLAVYFGLALRKVNWKCLLPICIFFLFVGAVQYKECFRQEYRSTYVPQTMEFFEENLAEDDVIVYNWEAFLFIYKMYFPADKLVYVEDFDFSGEYNNVWFINTKHNPQIDSAVLQANGLSMDIIGLYGIEHNEFDLYMIYRNEY